MNITLIFKPRLCFHSSHYEKFLATGEVKCIDDEIPFEIPKGWEWVRLGLIYSHNTGKALNGAQKQGTLLKYITTSNLYWNRFDLNDVRSMYFTDSEIDKCTVVQGDLLVCEGGDYGRSAIWDKPYSICIQNHIHRLRAYSELCTRFFLYTMYLYKNIGIIGGKGIGIQGLSSGALHNIILPLPPLSEQIRITLKLDNLIPVIEKYHHSQSQLDCLNYTIKERLKKSILQEAIQGRLVPQDPADEPASVLLEQIRLEKQRLLKEDKLKKKDITDSTIFKGDDNKYYERINGKLLDVSDEIPFDIPDSWRWARIKALFQTTSGGTPEKGHPEYYGGDIPWVKVGDLTDIYLAEASETISQSGYQNSSAKLFPVGTILVAMYCNDAIGKSSILTNPMTTNQAICGLYPNVHLCKEYIYYAIQANKGRLKEQAAGGAQNNINQKIVNELLLPIPPREEQDRIVNRIRDINNCL